MINRHDAYFILPYISPAVKTILEYEPQDAHGQCVLDFVCSDDIPALKKMDSSLINTDVKNATLICRIRHKDGHPVWLESMIHAIPDPLNGEVSEFYNVTRDITLRKTAEAIAHRRDRVLHGFATASGFLLTDRLQDPIPRMLATIGGAIGAEIAYIYEDTRCSTTFGHVPVRRFYWMAKIGKTDSTPPTHQACGERFSRKWAEKFASGAWVTGRRSRFSESIREMLDEMSVRSILIVPIHVGDLY